MMSKWIHSHKNRISLTAALDVIQTLLEKGEKLNWAEFLLGKTCKNEVLRFLLSIHLRKLFFFSLLMLSGTLLSKGMTAVYRHLAS